MCVFRSQLHLGHKDPLVETDDIDNSAITQQKIADGAVTHNKVANDAALSNGQLAQASTTVRGGVKIDGTTLYWENDVLKSLRGGVPEQYIKSIQQLGVNNSILVTNQGNVSFLFRPVTEAQTNKINRALLPLEIFIFDKVLYLRCNKGLLQVSDSHEVSNYHLGFARYMHSYSYLRFGAEYMQHRELNGWIYPRFGNEITFRLYEPVEFEYPGLPETDVYDYWEVKIKGYENRGINDFYADWVRWHSGTGTGHFNQYMYYPVDLSKKCAFALFEDGKRISEYAKFRVQRTVKPSLPVPTTAYYWARW